ncbi:MAG: AmmeMemoRadiSam system protein A [Melioribacteraceae bacterium]|nr:AmmeMemoRadiSam system protein A [Melioribacteraceae bacterium]
MVLSIPEKKHLILLAHFSIESGFKPTLEPLKNNGCSEFLNSKLGVFVTLTINGKLRGCIGYVHSDDELCKTVMNAAFQAAFNDPRFAPLTEEEFPKIKISISVLSPTMPLQSYEDIIIGKHGLILEESGRKGLLLPQVPIDHNMNRDTFLSALCRKAGFNENYWREKKLNLKCFTANVFSEEDEELK